MTDISMRRQRWRQAPDPALLSGLLKLSRISLLVGLGDGYRWLTRDMEACLCPVEFGYSRYLFHDPSALSAFTLPYFLPIASDFRAIKVNPKRKSFE